MNVTLVPAYGRDYKSKAEVEKDFYANKDFQMASLFQTGMTSCKELVAMGHHTVNIRYNKLQKIAVLKI